MVFDGRNKMHSDKFTQYTKVSYSGTKLLEKYPLNTEGVWIIEGEDPNCDYGGCHSNPYLVTVTGKLEDVLEYATNLNGFWTWGSGGNIKYIGNTLPKITPDSNKQEEKRKQRIRELEDELVRLKNA